MFRATLTGLLLALLCNPSKADPPPAYGLGAAPCSKFLSDVALHGDQGRAFYYSWAQGFITATNALLSSDEYAMVMNLRAKMADDEQQWLLDTLCRAHPEQDFSRAAMQLLDKIRQAEGLRPLMK
jgi:hypothetical protein